MIVGEWAITGEMRGFLDLGKWIKTGLTVGKWETMGEIMKNVDLSIETSLEWPNHSFLSESTGYNDIYLLVVALTHSSMGGVGNRSSKRSDSIVNVRSRGGKFFTRRPNFPQ